MRPKTRTSYHGEQRTKDRLGISKRLAVENAQKAIQYGFDRQMAHGELRRYLDKYRAPVMKAYNRHIYLFTNDQCLITILTLPNSLCARADAIQRKHKETTQQKPSTTTEQRKGEMRQ